MRAVEGNGDMRIDKFQQSGTNSLVITNPATNRRFELRPRLNHAGAFLSRAFSAARRNQKGGFCWYGLAPRMPDQHRESWQHLQ